MLDGAYGIMEEQKLVPRWTFSIQKFGEVRQVEDYEITDLPNTVCEVRMIAPIHKLHSSKKAHDAIYRPIDEANINGRHEEGEFDIDLEEKIESVTHRRNRMLKFERKEKEFRNRNKADDMEPENIVNVSSEELDEIRNSVEDAVTDIRHYLTRETVPLLLGYDIAAGEVEAITADQLKTPFTIDSEIFGYLERISVAGLLSRRLAAVLPAEVADHVIKDWTVKELDMLRTRNNDKKQSKSQREFRRMLKEYDGLIAREDSSGMQPKIGVMRGQTRHGADDYYFDK